jgi:hypothetical protein
MACSTGLSGAVSGNWPRSETAGWATILGPAPRCGQVAACTRNGWQRKTSPAPDHVLAGGDHVAGDRSPDGDEPVRGKGLHLVSRQHRPRVPPGPSRAHLIFSPGSGLRRRRSVVPVQLVGVDPAELVAVAGDPVQEAGLAG